LSGNVCASLERCSDSELAVALEATLRVALGRRCEIASLERRHSACYSSRTLLELDVRLDDGTRLAMVAKDVGPEGEIEAARDTRPAFLRDPCREIAVYRDVLGVEPLGTPVCYGAAIDRGAGRFWLFLERFEGRELYRVGDFEIWKTAARWLARFHTTFSGRREKLAETNAHLLVYDGNHFRRWMHRAREFVQSDDRSRAAAVAWLSERYEAVVERLLEMPCTLIHGEFYASNVLAQETPAGLRICPIDWEMAGWGPPAIDLAALVSGDWQPAQVTTLADEYAAAWASRGGQPVDRPRLHETIACCRLHLAVQWLGWSRNWRPPREHARDWLAEALTSAEQLDL
jgi:aminoglycoside phosphotransferase (APT) family kinase protein